MGDLNFSGRVMTSERVIAEGKTYAQRKTYPQRKDLLRPEEMEKLMERFLTIPRPLLPARLSGETSPQKY